jgi:hypothetical protein
MQMVAKMLDGKFMVVGSVEAITQFVRDMSEISFVEQVPYADDLEEYKGYDKVKPLKAARHQKIELEMCADDLLVTPEEAADIEQRGHAAHKKWWEDYTAEKKRKEEAEKATK